MKRLLLGIALSYLLPACIQATPLANEEKTPEEQLRESIGPFCDHLCALDTTCQVVDIADDCPAHCREHMAAFVDHGDQCVNMGRALENCFASFTTCDTFGNPEDCDPMQAQYAFCEQQSSPPAPPPVLCNSLTTGASASSGPGVSPDSTTCDIGADQCDDGASYRVTCQVIDSALTCNCFRNGMSGATFTRAVCPLAEEINQPCGWDLAM